MILNFGGKDNPVLRVSVQLKLHTKKDMLRTRSIIAILCLLLTGLVAGAEELVIQGSWKVSFEDNAAFSKADYDDSKWDELPQLKWSDDHKTTANRVLWIRKTVFIPSGLKAEFEKTGALSLNLGKILQSDDTYLNGVLLGSTGSGDTYRNYLVKKEDILWDRENKIAIRVRHWGSFNVSVVPKFVAASPDNFFKYGTGVTGGDPRLPVLNRNLTYQLTIANKSPRAANAVVSAGFYGFSGEKIYSARKNAVLSPGANDIDFSFTAPVGFLKIVYTVSVPDYSYRHEWNAEYGYESLVYKPVLPVITYKATQRYVPSGLDKQEVGGWLGKHLEANTSQRLKKVDEDALLAGFINRPGNHSWIGEHIGKFLEAACNSYENNHDPELKIQLDRSAQQLIAAQLPDGYLGTYEMDSHWTSWDVWSHRYDLMGLLRYYELTGFKPALSTCEKIGNLLITTFGTGKGQKDIVRAGGHVGMAATCILESMAELYRFSGDKRYLDFCYYVIRSYDDPNGPRIISTLDSLGRVDKVANAKAYEMLSNILGIVKMYRLTNDPQFLKPVLAAWNDIVKNRLYITGTASSFEHFQENDVLPAEKNANMGEGCVTTTWVQLNYQLLCISGEMKYLDELERSVYNHLTGAENPETGCVSYYTPLMGAKPYGCSITCCMSSVPRGIALVPLFVSGKIDQRPSFLFYEPGRFTTQVGGGVAAFTTSSKLPESGEIYIHVDASPAAMYELAFRRPYWASDFKIAVNGKLQPFSTLR